MSADDADAADAADTETGHPAPGHPNPHLVRMGGWCGVVGGILAIVFFLVRPRTPTYRGDLAPILEVFATNGPLFEIHTIGISAAILLVLGGFVGLREAVRGEAKAAAYARLALTAGVVLTPLFLLDAAVDGTILVELARLWMEAPEAEKASVRYVGELAMLVNVVILGRGVVLFGLTILLFGLGTAASDRFSRRLGWAGVLIGLLGVLTGAGMALQGVPSMTMLLPVFVAVLLAFAWTAGVGWAMRGLAEEFDAEAGG